MHPDARVPMEVSEFRGFVGSYTRAGGRGIHQIALDRETGGLRELACIYALNPSYLAVHPSRDLLYCVHECRGSAGEPSGLVSEFTILPDGGGLARRRTVSTGGLSPAHLAVQPDGRALFVANYNGESVARLALGPSGELASRPFLFRPPGAPTGTARQTRSHPHGVTFDPRGERVLVTDLGLDSISSYRLDAGFWSDPAVTNLPRGLGPRHLVFDASPDRAYVLCELGSELVVLDRTDPAGTFQVRQRVGCGGRDRSRTNHPAAIKLHPRGGFIYCSNRGDDSISVFAIEGRSGELTWRQDLATGGCTPRDFELTPDGRWLVAVNQASDSLTVFCVDPASGRLASTGRSLAVTAPASLIFLPPV